MFMHGCHATMEHLQRNYCIIMPSGYPPGSGGDNTSLRNFVTRVKIDAAVTRAVELEDRFGGSMIESIPLMKPLSMQNRATLKRGSTITKLKGDIYMDARVLVVKVFGLSALIAFSANAATYNSNGSVSDIQAKINSAANGDSVTVPAGSFTWSGTFINGKGITLQGAGIGVTIIHAPNTWQINNSPADPPFRVTGFTFDNGGVSKALLLRITGNGPGLIDHCYFSDDGGEMIHNEALGASDASGWSDAITPGSAQFVYFEDCTFNNASQGAYFYGCSALQSYYGARTCIRHCIFNYCQIDAHGTAGMIGARWYEYYNNTFWTPSGGNQSSYIVCRAGSGVIFNNITTGGPNKGGGNIYCYEEDTGSYPQLYQVGHGINQHYSPLYIWNNPSMPAGGDGNLVQLGRDLFVSTSQPANMIRWENGSDTASTTFNYVPYTYPHPLQNAGGTPRSPSAPGNLRVVPGR
jgi:hypothetical protein